MGGFKLGGMTFGSLFKKPETVLYPIERKPAPEGLKGHVECDLADCIYCGLCAKCCPAHAIEVKRDESAWSIDFFGCVQCGNCIESCPKGCLSMNPLMPAVSTKKDVFVLKGE